MWEKRVYQALVLNSESDWSDKVNTDIEDET